MRVFHSIPLQSRPQILANHILLLHNSPIEYAVNDSSVSLPKLSGSLRQLYDLFVSVLHLNVEISGSSAYTFHKNRLSE